MPLYLGRYATPSGDITLTPGVGVVVVDGFVPGVSPDPAPLRRFGLYFFLLIVW